MLEGARRVTLNVSGAHISQQLLFHATFGGYVEDTGVLGFVTGQTGWSSRRDMEPHFRALKATAAKIPGAASISPFNLVYCARMAGSTLMQGAAQTTQVTNANPQFSGFRTRLFTPEMEEQKHRDRLALAPSSTKRMESVLGCGPRTAICAHSLETRRPSRLEP